MRIIAFITYSADIARILEHIGVDAEAPRMTPMSACRLRVNAYSEDEDRGDEQASYIGVSKAGPYKANTYRY